MSERARERGGEKERERERKRRKGIEKKRGTDARIFDLFPNGRIMCILVILTVGVCGITEVGRH